jgi:AcrR family transcriptional regulator
MTQWNTPKQARSQIRFERLLSSAAELIVQHGIDAISTNHIADHAAIPIGSLYQFFPSKEALLAALIDQYSRSLIASFPAFDASMSFEQMVAMLIRELIAFNQAHPAFAHLIGYSPMPGDTPMLSVLQESIVHYVASMLELYFPSLNQEARNRCALVGFGIVKGITELNALPYELLALELTTVLTAYVRAFVART